MSGTPTSSNGLNNNADSLKNHQIGSPADGRRLNGSGTPGTDINSGITASQNSELRPVMVTPVDCKVIEGSGSGDSRAEADFSMDSFQNQAGPRGETENEGA